MSWTLCTSGSAIAKAGNNANSTITASGSTLAAWSDEVESEICDITRYDVVTNYGDLTTNGKKILNRLASAMIAQQIITYDLGSYGSMRNAETILDFLEGQITKATAILREDKNKTYLSIT